MRDPAHAHQRAPGERVEARAEHVAPAVRRAPLGDAPGELGGGERPHRGRRRGGLDAPVPRPQQRRRRAQVRGRLGRRQHAVAQLCPRQRERVALQAARRGRVPVVAGAERRREPLAPEAVVEVDADERRRVGWAVVGAHDHAAGRVQRRGHVRGGDRIGLPARAGLPAGLRQHAVAEPAHGHATREPAAHRAARVGGDEVQRQDAPVVEAGQQLAGARGAMGVQAELQRRPRVPWEAHRERAGHAVEDRPDDRAARRDEDLLGDRATAAHRDRLDVALARRPPVALAHSPAGAELLEEAVRQVGHARGDPPRDPAVVAGDESRGADEARPDRAPFRRAQLREVDAGRHERREMEVVGEQRPPARGARGRHRPGVGGARPRRDREERAQVGLERLEHAGARRPPRRPDERVERPQRLRAVGLEQLQACQLREPVGACPEGLEVDVGDDVGRRPRGARGAQQHELVRPVAHGLGSIDPGRVGADALADAGRQERLVGARGAMEPEPAREAVDGDAARADERGQRAARGAEDPLELEGAVLAVAEPEAEPRAGLVGRLHGRDAVGVAGDRHRRREARDLEPARRGGQPRAEHRAPCGPRPAPAHRCARGKSSRRPAERRTHFGYADGTGVTVALVSSDPQEGT